MREIMKTTDDRMAVNNIHIKLPIRRYEKYDQNHNIKSFGDNNIYPQQLRNLILSSPTGSICYRRYKDFIFGTGIQGGDDVMVNDHQSLNDLVEDMAHSLAMFGGAALHFRYNKVGQITAIHCLPFETIRLGEDDDFGFIKDYVFSPDWTEDEITRGGREINNLTDVTRYLPYNDIAANTVSRFKEDGVESYKGDILYISNTRSYPVAPADCVAADLSTEEGLVHIAYRNARVNFKPSCIIAYKHGTQETNLKMEQTIASMIGDESSSGVAIVKVKDYAEMPQTIELKTENYDDAYKTTTEVVQERIYAAFKSETFYLLRTGHIGFGGDVEADAFNLMNMSVNSERKIIERTLKRIQKRLCANIKFPEIKIGNLLYQKDDSTINNNSEKPAVAEPEKPEEDDTEN